MNTSAQQVTGYPFVSHVDQEAKPTIENVQDFLKRAYVRFYTNNQNIISTGYYKNMGYAYNLRPFLTLYIYKQYGQWNEAYAPNKTMLRQVIGGRIDKIIEA
jgi:hypothetical protein